MIENLEQAVDRIERILQARHYHIHGGRYINKNRHFWCAVKSPESENFGIYSMFKREFFFKYSEFFNAENGTFGDSINLDYYLKFRRTQENSATTFKWILIAYPHAIYRINAAEWMKFIDQTQHIRMQQGVLGNPACDGGEVTCSFPIKLFENWGEPWSSRNLNDFMNVVDNSKMPDSLRAKILRWIARTLKKTLVIT